MKTHSSQSNDVKIIAENIFRNQKVKKCNECGEEFFSQNQLKHHMSRVHPEKGTMPMETEEEIKKKNRNQLHL